jgi:hypothetical protein
VNTIFNPRYAALPQAVNGTYPKNILAVTCTNVQYRPPHTKSSRRISRTTFTRSHGRGAACESRCNAIHPSIPSREAGRDRRAVSQLFEGSAPWFVTFFYVSKIFRYSCLTQHCAESNSYPRSATLTSPQPETADRSLAPSALPWFKGGTMNRPIGITVIAILMFLVAVLLVLASTACFFVGVMNVTAADSHDPVTAAIIGMTLAAGFSLLLLAAVNVTLGIGVLQLRETARRLCMASISIGVALSLAALFVLVLHPPAEMIAAQLLLLAAYVGTLAYLVSRRVRQAFTPALITP